MSELVSVVVTFYLYSKYAAITLLILNMFKCHLKTNQYPVVALTISTKLFFTKGSAKAKIMHRET
jgi:hypothetical protein